MSLGKKFSTIMPSDKARAEEISKLVDLTSRGKAYHVGTRMAYDLDNLIQRLDSNYKAKMTIEFRQHEGTLDSERVAHWVNVCVGLVEFADTVDSDLLESFLHRHIDDNEEYNVIDLLRAIAQPAAADFYEKKGLFL